MRHVIRYDVVVAANPVDLSGKVTALCEKGYVPHGSPLLWPDPIRERGEDRIAQAVVIYGEEY